MSEVNSEFCSDDKEQKIDLIREVIELFDKERLFYYVAEETYNGLKNKKEINNNVDSFDLVLPRPYFEKAKKILLNRAPKDLLVYTYDSKDEYLDYCISVYYAHDKEEKFCVRIYPLDGMPQNAFIYVLHCYLLARAKARYVYNNEKLYNQINAKNKLILKIWKLTDLKKSKTQRDSLEAIDRILKRINNKATKKYINYMYDNRLSCKSYNREDYGNGILVEFEDMMLRIPYYLKM